MQAAERGQNGSATICATQLWFMWPEGLTFFQSISSSNCSCAPWSAGRVSNIYKSRRGWNVAYTIATAPEIGRQCTIWLQLTPSKLSHKCFLYPAMSCTLAKLTQSRTSATWWLYGRSPYTHSPMGFVNSNYQCALRLLAQNVLPCYWTAPLLSVQSSSCTLPHAQ